MPTTFRRSTTISRRLALLVTLIALAAFAPARIALAQASPNANTEAAQGPIFASPADVMRAVLDYYDRGPTADDESLDRAGSALHDTGPSVGRRERLRFLVRDRLARILDRVDLGDADLAPSFAEASEVEGRNAWLWKLAGAKPPLDQISIGFERMPDGGWLIDSATVNRLESMYEAVKSAHRVTSANARPMSTSEWVRSVVPPKLQGGGFLLEAYQWLGLLALLLLAFFFERLITLFLRPLINRLVRFEGVQLKKELLHSFERPFGLLLLTLIFLGAIRVLDLPEDVYLVLRIAAGLFMTVVGVWAAYCLVDIVCWPLQVRAERTTSKLDDMLVPLLRRTLKVVVILVGFVFAISRLTGDVNHVLAGLSIGSLAIGFAAKDSIENLFGTFTVLLDSPFKIGDVVKFADVEGTVEEVGFRSTRIRTPEDSLVTVPNSKFIGNWVDNLGLKRVRRIRIVLGLEYGTPPEKIEAFCEGVRELVRAHPLTANENYHVSLTGFSASSLDVEMICFIKALDYATYTRERHRLLLDLLRLAQKLNVSFALPTQTVRQVVDDGTAHADSPTDTDQAIKRGRDAAQQLAAVSVGRFKAAPPRPVRYDDPDGIGR